MNSSLPFLYIKQKKLQKDLGGKKINTTFASLFQNGGSLGRLAQLV